MKTDKELEEYNKCLFFSSTAIKKRYVIPLNVILGLGNTFHIKRLKESSRS